MPILFILSPCWSSTLVYNTGRCPSWETGSHDLNTKSARSQDTHIPSPVSSTVSQFLLLGLDDQRCEFISQKHTQTWSPNSNHFRNSGYFPMWNAYIKSHLNVLHSQISRAALPYMTVNYISFLSIYRIPQFFSLRSCCPRKKGGKESGWFCENWNFFWATKAVEELLSWKLRCSKSCYHHHRPWLLQLTYNYSSFERPSPL